MSPPTRNEEDEEISRGEGRDLDVERSDQGVSVHQPGASVDEGQGEEDVLQTVDDHQTSVLSLHSQPLPTVVVLAVLGLSVPVSQYLRDHQTGQTFQNDCETFLQIKTRAVLQKCLKTTIRIKHY